MKYIFIILILFAALLEYIGDSNIKHYARGNKNKNLVIGIIAYILIILMLIRLLRQSNVMYMNIMWDAVSIILETLLAFILLGETLDNNYQIAGGLLIIIGIILMTIGNIPY